MLAAAHAPNGARTRKRSTALVFVLAPHSRNDSICRSIASGWFRAGCDVLELAVLRANLVRDDRQVQRRQARTAAQNDQQGAAHRSKQQPQEGGRCRALRGASLHERIQA
jgi:hypothetical protein